MDPLIPLDQLLSGEGAGKIMRAGNPRRVAMLYAESWALVHYLMLSDNAARAREQIKVYLEAIEKGLPLERAFPDRIRSHVPGSDAAALGLRRQERIPGDDGDPERGDLLERVGGECDDGGRGRVRAG